MGAAASGYPSLPIPSHAILLPVVTVPVAGTNPHSVCHPSPPSLPSSPPLSYLPPFLSTNLPYLPGYLPTYTQDLASPVYLTCLPPFLLSVLFLFPLSLLSLSLFTSFSSSLYLPSFSLHSITFSSSLPSSTHRSSLLCHLVYPSFIPTFLLHIYILPLPIHSSSHRHHLY